MNKYISITGMLFLFLISFNVNSAECDDISLTINTSVQSILNDLRLGNIEAIKKTKSELEASIKSCKHKIQSYAPSLRKKLEKEITISLTRLSDVKDFHIGVLVKTIAELKDAASSSEVKELKKKVDNYKELFEGVKDYRSILKEKEPELTSLVPMNKGWGNSFNMNFYVGYEGANTDAVKEKTTARGGLNMYLQTSSLDKTVKELQDNKIVYKWDLYAPHLYLSYFESSAAETATQDENVTAGPIEELPRTTDLELGVFWPLLVSTNSSLGASASGLLGGFTDIQVDDNDTLTKYYFGLRYAHSPNMYADIIFPRYEGSNERRTELRLQMPFTSVADGEVLIGFIYNRGDNTYTDVELTDTRKIYVMWEYKIDGAK